MLGTPIHFWVVFLVVTVASLAIDLGVFHRKAHRVQVREALIERFTTRWGGRRASSFLPVIWSRNPSASITSSFFF
jgi:hypothetical protein